MKAVHLGKKVVAVAQYYDARLVHPERLALELIKDAERDCPQSIAIPYMSLAGTAGATITLRDEETVETTTLTPKMVINCTGAWADEADGTLAIDRKLIGGTRGSHLVLKRPDIEIEDVKKLNPSFAEFLNRFDEESAEQAMIKVKYESYIEKERLMGEKMSKLEDLEIITNFDYDRVSALSFEGRQKLKKLRPQTLGQASRISGVSPSDVSVLLIYLGR